MALVAELCSLRNDDFDPAIALPAVRIVRAVRPGIGGNRVVRAHADSAEARGFNACLLHKPGAHCVGTLLGEPQVVGGRPLGVGVPLDPYFSMTAANDQSRGLA